MKFHLMALLAGAMALGMAFPAVAQQPAGHNIAVIDVSVIFKDHVRFKQAIEQMKTEVEQVENSLKADYENMKKMAEQIKAMNPGSPEFKKLETDFAKADLDFKFKRAQSSKDFAEREGKLYYAIYLEIDQVVKEIAIRNNIALVLRHHSDKIDSNDRTEILRGISKPIVYVNPALDITQHVLNVLNRGAVQPATTPATAQVPGVARPGVQIRQ
ncbi:MAG: OmpH family outer membrane protein [Pirellulales bacterium]|nr:OmpH family outer membrane protein [Pirellulales bacterium]